MKSFDIFSVYLPGPCPSIFPISCFHSKQIYMKNIIKSSITSLSMIYCQMIYPKTIQRSRRMQSVKRVYLLFLGPWSHLWCFHGSLFYPKQTMLRGYTGITLTVRPSMICPGYIFLHRSINFIKALCISYVKL